MHDNEITYSIICTENEQLFSEGISGAYKLISKCLLGALKHVGLDAAMHTHRLPSKADCASQKISCFHSPSRYEIIISGRKLVGSAQRRFKKAFLQHGSILFGINKELVVRLLGEESLQRMAWIGLYSDVKEEEFKASLIDKIKSGLDIGLAAGYMSNDENYLKEKFIQEKIANYDLQIII